MHKGKQIDFACLICDELEKMLPGYICSINEYSNTVDKANNRLIITLIKGTGFIWEPTLFEKSEFGLILEFEKNTIVINYCQYGTIKLKDVFSYKDCLAQKIFVQLIKMRLINE